MTAHEPKTIFAALVQHADILPQFNSIKYLIECIQYWHGRGDSMVIYIESEQLGSEFFYAFYNHYAGYDASDITFVLGYKRD